MLAGCARKRAMEDCLNKNLEQCEVVCMDPGTASNDIARNVERIAQMTEETSAAIVQASSTAQTLEALASKLHAEVSQFKTV